MPYRLTRLRVVASDPNCNITACRPVSLWRAALSAAEETIHGSPMAPAWLQLFRAHLSGSDAEMLRWRGDLGESFEMRRVYSGLYGRYFARALLGSELGITDFISLDGDIVMQNGTTVTRAARGDIPDWIAWDSRAQAYVLAEAKGRLAGSEHGFLHGTPSCVHAGKAQFERVAVRDSGGRTIATRNWVAANLWSTDERRREPVSLLWDPPDDGDSLVDDEVPRHAVAIRKHRIAAITKRLGAPAFTVRIAMEPSDDSESPAIFEAVEDSPLGPIERPSRQMHEGDYLAAIITPLGVRPIRGADDLKTAQIIREEADRAGEPAMLFGVAKGEPRTRESRQMPWLSNNGIASPDGLSLFNLRSVDIGES